LVSFPILLSGNLAGFTAKSCIVHNIAMVLCRAGPRGRAGVVTMVTTGTVLIFKVELTVVNSFLKLDFTR